MATYWHAINGKWVTNQKRSPYPTSVYKTFPYSLDNYPHEEELVLEELDPDSSKYVSKGVSNPSYSDLIDQIQKNNTFSAEQAQKQMEFQERMFNEANAFNRDEAELNRAFQQESADKAMAFSSAENETNRQWQQMMSNTAHQREMADLKAAGLNPILAANNGASAGSGSAAMSASAAGNAASSTGSPSGSKANTDESGTMAIANLLGKMLDNQTEIQKMIVSAETAKETADMYTGATRYAAELGQIASQYASDNSYASSHYASDINAQIASMNPYNILGEQINGVLNSFASRGYSANNISTLAEVGAKSLAEKAKSVVEKVVNKLKIDRSTSKHYVGKF